ncbi:4847_t:CDS:2 [Ambispora gerdemannii]|uniref:4847_t:CDS:1 n=1 Tax=Ambispora gerdemannii TaxID=144530 RepID=A0A9N9B4F2_9GLOM|nr:4847_t:CDS:2 [Ambispora gerdemannii]
MEQNQLRKSSQYALSTPFSLSEAKPDDNDHKRSNYLEEQVVKDRGGNDDASNLFKNIFTFASSQNLKNTDTLLELAQVFHNYEIFHQELRRQNIHDINIELEFSDDDIENSPNTIVVDQTINNDNFDNNAGNWGSDCCEVPLIETNYGFKRRAANITNTFKNNLDHELNAPFFRPQIPLSASQRNITTIKSSDFVFGFAGNNNQQNLNVQKRLRLQYDKETGSLYTIDSKPPIYPTKNYNNNFRELELSEPKIKNINELKTEAVNSNANINNNNMILQEKTHSLPSSVPQIQISQEELANSLRKVQTNLKSQLKKFEKSRETSISYEQVASSLIQTQENLEKLLKQIDTSSALSSSSTTSPISQANTNISETWKTVALENEKSSSSDASFNKVKLDRANKLLEKHEEAVEHIGTSQTQSISFDSTLPGDQKSLSYASSREKIMLDEIDISPEKQKQFITLKDIETSLIKFKKSEVTSPINILIEEQETVLKETNKLEKINNLSLEKQETITSNDPSHQKRVKFKLDEIKKQKFASAETQTSQTNIKKTSPGEETGTLNAKTKKSEMKMNKLPEEKQLQIISFDISLQELEEARLEGIKSTMKLPREKNVSESPNTNPEKSPEDNVKLPPLRKLSGNVDKKIDNDSKKPPIVSNNDIAIDPQVTESATNNQDPFEMEDDVEKEDDNLLSSLFTIRLREQRRSRENKAVTDNDQKANESDGEIEDWTRNRPPTHGFLPSQKKVKVLRILPKKDTDKKNDRKIKNISPKRADSRQSNNSDGNSQRPFPPLLPQASTSTTAAMLATAKNQAEISCNICQKQIKGGKTALNKHNILHKHPISGKHYCHLCKFSGFALPELREHLKQNHSDL